MLDMVDRTPLIASGPRDPAKPKPIPKPIRQMIKLMVFGAPGDQDFAPVPFLDAARQCGVSGDQARKYLDRANVRQLLMAERRAWRAAISSGNEGALLRIRDRSPNAMAQLGAVRALEQLEDGDQARPGVGQAQVPGMTIIIRSAPPLPLPDPSSSSLVIQHDPYPSPPDQGGAAGGLSAAGPFTPKPAADQAQTGPRFPPPARP